MGHINGLHVLIAALVVVGITVVVIARSPKAPQETAVEANDRADDAITHYTSPWQRAAMATFVANVMGYGSNSQYFARLRGSVLCEFAAYTHLFDALENARRINGFLTGEMSPDTKDRFVTTLVNDAAFIMNCALYVDFIAKLADDSFVINTPDGHPIPEEFIVPEPVISAYRALCGELWPGQGFNSVEV